MCGLGKVVSLEPDTTGHSLEVGGVYEGPHGAGMGWNGDP